MALPLQQSLLPELNQLQTKWKAQIDPVLALPLNAGHVLKDQNLVSGTNAINHLLGQNLKGWFIVRRRKYSVAYDIYDLQDSNQMPDKTLVLTCDQGTPLNPVVVDIYVF